MHACRTHTETGQNRIRVGPKIRARVCRTSPGLKTRNARGIRKKKKSVSARLGSVSGTENDGSRLLKPCHRCACQLSNDLLPVRDPRREGHPVELEALLDRDRYAE